MPQVSPVPSQRGGFTLWLSSFVLVSLQHLEQAECEEGVPDVQVRRAVLHPRSQPQPDPSLLADCCGADGWLELVLRCCCPPCLQKQRAALREAVARLEAWLQGSDRLKLVRAGCDADTLLAHRAMALALEGAGGAES